MKRLAHLLALIAMLAIGSSRTVNADSFSAKKAYEKGMTAYNLQSFREAMEFFKLAYQEKQDPAFLFNIGQCQRQLGQYDAAAKSYGAYLNQSPNLSNRADLVRLIEQMDAAAREIRAKEPPTGTRPPTVVQPPAPAAQVIVAKDAPTSTASVSVTPARRPWYKKPTGMALTGIGLAGAIVGASLLGVAGADASNAKSASTLPDQRRFNDDAGTFGLAGGISLAIGGALTIAGVIALSVQR